MDKTIRRNQICIVGMPRCDFVFSSTRTCFIAYGFENSPLEVSILKGLLEKRGVLAVEAGGALAPGQNAFCAKICSKIITSQFCVVLVNNEEADGREIPNANVNMEYGLMLGFNKYVIPFQRANQGLPFNVAGLDTIKYTNVDFEHLAAAALDQAIRETQQDAPPPFSPDQILEVFLLAKKALVTPINTDGDRNLYQIGAPLGFNLLNDFSGMSYVYFGNFTALRPEVVIWRVKMLTEILDGRGATLDARVEAGVATEVQARALDELLGRLQIWAITTSNDDKAILQGALRQLSYPVEVFSVEDVRSELENLGRGGA